MTHQPIPTELVRFVSSHRCTLFGEIHGTNEYPAAFGALVKELLRNGTRRLWIHLELREPLTPHLIEFITEGIDPPPHTVAIEEGDFRWTKALKEMLRGLRDQLLSGQLEIRCFDGMRSAIQQEGEQMLADNLLRGIAEDPSGLHLAYCGNVHAAVERSGSRSFDFETAGTILNRSLPDVGSVELVTTGGSTRCLIFLENGEIAPKVIPLRGSEGAAPTAGSFGLCPEGAHYSGEWNIGATTPAF